MHVLIVIFTCSGSCMCNNCICYWLIFYYVIYTTIQEHLNSALLFGYMYIMVCMRRCVHRFLFMYLSKAIWCIVWITSFILFNTFVYKMHLCNNLPHQTVILLFSDDIGPWKLVEIQSRLCHIPNKILRTWCKCEVFFGIIQCSNFCVIIPIACLYMFKSE